MKKVKLIILIFITFFLFACSKVGFIYYEDKVNIVATTTMLGDLAREIGGDKVNVTTLMNSGVDPHQYQTKASDTKGLLEADLILVNGLHLEGQMGYVLEKLAKERVLAVGDYLDKETLIHLENDVIDPHIWFDVSLWMVAASALRDKLINLDEENENIYEANTSYYLEQLTNLDTYIKEKASLLPKEKRILITAHDAFNYFARAYGFEVHSIQGISTESEASIKDIKELAQLTKELDVKAIFVESSVSEATVKSVIDAAKAIGHPLKVGGELYSDSLGDDANNTETYIKTVKANIDIIINSLTGGN